jgi:tricorn protease
MVIRDAAASRLRALASLAVLLFGARAAIAATLPAASPVVGRTGYYSDPAVHGDTVVFTSEGDLWSVDIRGGAAHRLTSNTGDESSPKISPDGQTLAFVAQYEGPSEVYTMPLTGGIPQRRTWDGDAVPAAWSPDGRLVVRTSRYSTLPDPKLVMQDADGRQELLPLASAAEAAYSADGHSVFFTRWRKQSSSTKRYRGGWAESLWRFDGNGEALPLTTDWTGTSHGPMVWNGRVYFLSDRDGIMNVWSMDPSGHDVRQESRQRIYDVRSASLSAGRVVYACGADLWLLELGTGQEQPIPIVLTSDFDQLRDHWVKAPLDYLTDVHVAPDGGSAVFTARGEVFTLPAKSGRIVKVAADPGVRFRSARFLPDGKSLVLLSTATGETEFWRYPANGVGAPEQWTHDAQVLRWDGVVSPDSHWLAHYDKDQQLWVFDLLRKRDQRVAQSANGDFADLRWSPDSRWLAFTEAAANDFQQIRLLRLDSGEIRTLTSDRYNSTSPAWSTDGKWLYFLSDRALQTNVDSPWGPRQPDPHFDRPVKIYALGLQPGLRSPFLPPDELHPEGAADKPAADKPASKDKKHAVQSTAAAGPQPEVKIDFEGLATRLTEVPAARGNYSGLEANDQRLCWLSADDAATPRSSLQCLDIANKGDEAETLTDEVTGFEFSADGKKLLVTKKKSFYLLDADAKAAVFGDAKALEKLTIDLSGWRFATTPRAEFHGIFQDAWRLERDYFYDRHMHGIDWPAMRARYEGLVDRVSDREELNDLIAQMVGELSALHTFVHGGDQRRSGDNIDLAGLGARLERDSAAGGFVVAHVYRHDPDQPNAAPPLSRPESWVAEGEVIEAIDGDSTLAIPDERVLLRGKAGSQVLLRVKSPAGVRRDVLVRPVRAAEEANLRYAEWEYTRRLAVESAAAGTIGYVHLRAMGSEDIDQWAREYYPVFNRQGLIIDVRHNHGGNIDSWLLGKLLRQAWFYWQPRVGTPEWNMQYAFRGHIVVLCDQETASDGEAFTEGFRRFKLGQVIGTRTWGGEIWLSGSNLQADGGVATAGEIGVYGPEGRWLIEGHGVDPDIVVDDLPHATFEGEDAQLQAAVRLLQSEIKTDPRPVPPAPAYPNKAPSALP